MAILKFESVTKRYGGVTAVKDMAFETRDGEFLVILGPSGAGKTTTLKISCGLVNPDEGKVYLDGENITRFPPYRRDIAMTFENYSLYPHMTVFDNMANPLRAVKGEFTEEQIKKRVGAIAKMLHIDPLLHRLPAEASGGQKQRIALGRTMVRRPKVYLLDEPLAHLDAKIRVELREEFHKIEELQQATTVYVTHDYTEALSLGDRIMILHHGEVLQVDTPNNIYYSPATLEVARQVGQPAINAIECVVKSENGTLFLQSKKTPKLRFHMLDRQAAILKDHGREEVILGVRPQDIGIVPIEGGEKIEAKVDVFQPLGSEGVLTALVDGSPIVSLVDPEAKIKHEQMIDLFFETRFFYLFDAESKSTLVS
jgi:multiple sugar transport system ATP-binding protein